MGELIPFKKPPATGNEQLTLVPTMTEGEIGKEFLGVDQYQDPPAPETPTENPVAALATKKALAEINADDTSTHEDTGYGDLVGKRIARSIKQISEGRAGIRQATALELQSPGWLRLGTAVEAIQEIGKYRPREIGMFERGYRAPTSDDLTLERANRIIRSDALGKIATHVKGRTRAQADPNVAQVTIASINGELVTNKAAGEAYDSVLDGMREFFEIYRKHESEGADQVMQRFSTMIAKQAGLASASPRDMPSGLVNRAWGLVAASNPAPPESA